MKFDRWQDFLLTLFPETYSGPMAPYHCDYWDWLWEQEPGTSGKEDTYIAVWPRGWGKSTNGEVGAIALGAKGYKYALYVCGTQEQVDTHVANISQKMTSKLVAQEFPDLATVRLQEVVVNDKSRARQLAWRHNRLWTKAGFAIDALGLEKAIRGTKLEDARPDVIILDDIDSEDDSPETIQKKIRAITTKILPAAAPHVVVLVLQNLVHRNGVVSQLVDGRADFLTRRIVSGPHPAIYGLETEGSGKDAQIVGGLPSWDVLGLDHCQREIERIGLSAFMSECQHDVRLTGQPRFNLDALGLQHARDPLPERVLPESLRGIDGLRVYELPVPGAAYVQYTDPAEGKGRDYTATGWMEARSLRLVALLEDNAREPQRHADIAVDIGEWYGSPLTGYERAKGEAIALVLGRRGVRRIYEHVDNPNTPQQWAAGLDEKRIPGFPMTEHSKRGIIDRLALALETMQVSVPDARVLDQLGTFVVTEKNKLEAIPGGHDDLVMMLAGLVLLAEQPGAQIPIEVELPVESGRRGWSWGRR